MSDIRNISNRVYSKVKQTDAHKQNENEIRNKEIETFCMNELCGLLSPSVPNIVDA